MLRTSLLRGTFALLFASCVFLSAQEPNTKPKATIEPAEAPKSALQKLTTYPAKIELNGPRDEQRIGIIGEYADGRTWDLSRTAKLTSANPKVAEIDATGIVRPVGAGETSVTIESNGKSQTRVY